MDSQPLDGIKRFADDAIRREDESVRQVVQRRDAVVSGECAGVLRDDSPLRKFIRAMESRPARRR